MNRFSNERCRKISTGGSKKSASPRNNVYRVTKLVHCFVIDTRKLIIDYISLFVKRQCYGVGFRNGSDEYVVQRYRFPSLAIP